MDIILDQERIIEVEGVKFEAMGPIAVIPDMKFRYPHGEWVGRHPNGIEAWHGSLLFGAKDGQWIFFDPEGIPTVVCNYQKDELHGWWLSFIVSEDWQSVAVKERKFYLEGRLIYTTHELGTTMVDCFLN